MQSIKLQTEESEGSESRSTAMQQLNFLTAGRVSVEDRSKRAETVRPQLGARSGEQRESDSALSATNDDNDEELDGGTDDEDTEDGETEFDDGSVQVRNIRDPGQRLSRNTEST